MLPSLYDQLTEFRVHFHTQLFYYSWAWYALDIHDHSQLLVWKHSYAVSDQLLRKLDRSHSFTAKMRWSGGGKGAGIPLVGGWHCSACMSAERISEKSRSFSHTEYNVVSVDWARYCIENGLDMFNRSEVRFIRNENAAATFPYCDGCKTLEDWIALIPKSESEPMSLSP